MEKDVFEQLREELHMVLDERNKGQMLKISQALDVEISKFLKHEMVVYEQAVKVLPKLK
ncbi:hypothetical protein HNQ80_002321 [Anaerosolibacter carboniphilus]|uniref:Spo0E like sporulation regulatory protein n=1 Tax=Anaerosolibacter carboniphilus TaxID=1417629 RepID=A0A841KZ81_9FIRM|nr:hypothetical protein [Anaerosolibacter carboniphilus]MBB6216222.1 hypothetical protein [Anaerosolibacter carboniphilus]